MIVGLPIVLHHVHIALPRQSGYTLRTHYIASSQLQRGHRVGVCVGLGSYAKAMRDVYGVEPCTERDGVPYFWYAPKIQPQTRFYSVIQRLSEKAVRDVARIRARTDMPRYADWLERNWFVPDVVHAHTPARTALAGWRMARKFKAAFIYEVRGFWFLSQATERGRQVDVDAAVAADVVAANKAHRVVAICQGIADVLVRNGVASSKISIVPNGVDAAAFAPADYDEELADQLGLKGRFVYGYATNVRRLEGVQDVVRAWPQIKKAVPEAVFLLIGDGDYMAPLRQLVRESGVQDDWKMVGRVPHSQVKSYYSLLDVFVVPRIAEPVCEIVTPLKPLEAMAMGIPVVASNVLALREMVADGRTGLVFNAGDPESLATVCIRIAADGDLRSAIQRSARDWVLAERDWRVIASYYHAVYQSMHA